MSKLFIKDRFATTPNNLLSNPDITLRAKGLFAFIQGKPDKWSFSAERIAFENKEGVQSVRSALQELEKFGYLRRLKTKNEKGHWEIDYILHSQPENPADEIPTLGIRPTENHTTENPTSGNPTLENHTNNSNTDVIKKDINNTINKGIYDKFTFSKIKDFQATLKSFTLNKSYFFIAYRFWELWKKESPHSKTLQDANIIKWYNAIRLIIETDKQKIERLLIIYFYFDKCQREEAGFDRFWFDTIKSVGAFRKKDRNDVYRIDVIMDKINAKIQADDAFNQLINTKIKEFKEYEITKLH